MKSKPISLTYAVEIEPGEILSLPPELTANIGAGSWVITIQPASDTTPQPMPTRSHSAFLHSYSDEDEGLYDDYTR